MPVRISRRNAPTQHDEETARGCGLGGLSALDIRAVSGLATGNSGIDNVAWVAPCTDVIPQLAVSLTAGGQILGLSWPANAGNFEVEWTADLLAGPWAPVTPQGQNTVGCRVQVTVNLPAGTGFYRLVKRD